MPTDAGLRSRAAPTEWAFRCTACGKCCNSAPELSVPELLRYERLFVGRLAVRRVTRFAPDGTPQVDAPPDWLLVTLAWTDERLERCPALGSDGRCTLHGAEKPSACVVAPLDALVPETALGRVLRQRARDAAYFGAGCLSPGPAPGFTTLVKHSRVVDPVARAAIGRRRRDLALDKRFWGNAVFRLLERDLFADPAALERIPPDGFMSLSIAPVVMVLAAVSPRCRARCVAYVEAQLALCRSLGLVEEVRVHEALCAALLAHGGEPAPDPFQVTATEAWLGLEAA